MNSRVNQFLLFFSDLFSFCLALIFAIIIRFGWHNNQFLSHLFAFSFNFLFTLIIFYAFQLYENLVSKKQYYQNYFSAIIINLAFYILIFYLLGSEIWGITPRRVLFLFFLIFVPLNLFIRNLIIFKFPRKEKIIFIDNFDQMNEIYENAIFVININKPEGPKMFSLALMSNKKVLSLSQYYELYFGKIDLTELDYEIINLRPEESNIFDSIKRLVDIVLSSIVFIILSPFIPIIILGIKLSSKGPILYKDERVGLRERVFYLYKFRTMHQTNVNFGNNFREEKEKRIFFFGKILRLTHLDELPQIINVIKGDISLVGPRPDSLKYYKLLKEKIPFYSLRTIVKPGITGWSQIKGMYGDSVEEAKERLAYDLYYIKYRNPLFDFLIILKTLSILIKGK